MFMNVVSKDGILEYQFILTCFKFDKTKSIDIIELNYNNEIVYAPSKPLVSNFIYIEIELINAYDYDKFKEMLNYFNKVDIKNYNIKIYNDDSVYVFDDAYVKQLNYVETSAKYTLVQIEIGYYSFILNNSKINNNKKINPDDYDFIEERIIKL